MPAWKKIGCGVDGSGASTNALRASAELARQFDAELVLVHVESAVAEALLAPPLAYGHRTAATEVRLSEWSALAEKLRGMPVRLELAWGAVASEIVAFAQREACDLLVLGTSAKHTAIFAIRSVAAHVIPHAPCSVLVVRQEGAKLQVPGSSGANAPVEPGPQSTRRSGGTR